MKKLRGYILVAVGFAVLLATDIGHPGSPTHAQSGSHYFPETNHTVKGRFLAYWEQHGGLAQQGYPISDEFQEVSTLDGNTYTVQYFERAVFELHPENAGTPYEVLLSQLGTFRYKARYGSGTPPLTPAPISSSQTLYGVSMVSADEG